MEEIFVGAKIEGDSGYINLLKIKEIYYSQVLRELKKEIDSHPLIDLSFKEEFFDKLFNFFDKYFSESGSVYFTKTSNWQRVYEKVYSDNRDVVLFWKTHMLYYVKSDVLFDNVSMVINDDSGEYNFYFDVGELITKQNNEKKRIIFELDKVSEKIIDGVKTNVTTIKVLYSTHGRITKIADISKEINVPDQVLNKAFSQFEKQSEVDFFINKNAKAFLEEQLDLYLHQLLLETDNKFDSLRLSQIKVIKEFALKIVCFISQFENELVKVWNKPKFVLDSDYVIAFKTLKKLINDEEYEKILEEAHEILSTNEEYANDIVNTIKEIYKQPLQKIYVSEVLLNENIEIRYVKGFKTTEALERYIQNNETEEELNITIVDRDRNIEGFFATYSSDNNMSLTSLEELYIDTKYFTENFKHYLISAISKRNNLDRVIDGYLVHSDNYQYLNSVNKFDEKISMVYIDPPFNTEGSSYAYLDKFKDSTWLTMLDERLKLTRSKFLSDNGSFYLHLDHHCNYLGRTLSDQIFTEGLTREIIWNTSPSLSGLKTAANNFIRQHDMILFYSEKNAKFNKMYTNYKNKDIKDLGWLDAFIDENKAPYIYRYEDNSSEMSKFYLEKYPTMAIGDVWNDVYSMMFTQNMTRENWGVDNTQKPENLLRRLIQASTDQGDWVMDYYSGTGTTLAASHKLNRKWIGVEFGNFIDSVILNRMKTVVTGDIRPRLSIDLNWQGGGFFKYYRLEQYEDTLRKSSYKQNQRDIFSEKKAFENYIFFSDNKLVDAMEINNNNEIRLELNNIYENIDLPETVSNLLGLPLSGIFEDHFTLDNNGVEIKYKSNFDEMNLNEQMSFIQLIKPLIWWGE